MARRSTAGKYHIGKNGVPEVCKATHRQCPYGRTGHFDTQAQAAEESQILLEKEFGVFVDNYSDHIAESRILNSQTYIQANYSEDGKSSPINTFTNDIASGSSRTTRRGIEYETFASYAYAQDLELEHSVTFSPKGEMTIYSNLDNPNLEKNMNKVYIDTQSKIIKKLRETDKEGLYDSSLIKMFHTSDDGETVVAQLGGSNTLDLAIIKGNKVEIVEVKKLNSGGAQIASKALSVTKEGKPYGDFSSMKSHVANQIQKIGFKDTIGTNKPVNLTKRESLEYVVDSYKEKGADKLSYLNGKGQLVEVNLNDETKAIVSTLEKSHVEAKVMLRSNMTFGVPSPEDKSRWETKRGDYFKSGKFPDKSFAIKDIKKSIYSMESCGGKATIGEIVLPYTKAQLLKLDPNTEIKVSQLRVRGLTLIGEIKLTPESRRTA